MSETPDTEAQPVTSAEERELRSAETSQLQLGVGLVAGVITVLFISVGNPNAPFWAAVLGGVMFGFFCAVMTAVIRNY